MSKFNIRTTNRRIRGFIPVINALAAEANRLYRRYDHTFGDVVLLERDIKEIEKSMARLKKAVLKLPIR